MKISLYINHSSEEHVNKNIELINTLDGYLRMANSIRTPEIEIESSGTIDKKYSLEYPIEVDDEIEYEEIDDTEILDSISILKCNYMYIHEFNKYYYVSDIIIMNNKLYRFMLEEDVLMTLKEQFLAIDAIVARNEFTYDINIEDEKEPFEFRQNVQEYVITEGRELVFNPALNSNTKPIYIIKCQSDVNYNNRNNIDSPISCLPAVSGQNAGVTTFANVHAMNASNVDLLGFKILGDESLATFIISLVCYPFEITDLQSSADHKLHLGTTTFNDVDCKYLKRSISKYYKVASFNMNQYQATNSFLNKEPYSKYELYLPYYGYIELKSSDILGCLIEVYYSFDWAAGTAKINVVNATRNYVIKSVTATIGVIIGIGRTNQQQLNDAKTQLAVKAAISSLASVASIGVGAFTDNPFLIASGVTGLSSTATDIGVQLSQMHEKAQTANNSGLEGLYGSQEVRLKVTRYVTKEPSNYAAMYGRPLNTRYLLGDLKGLTLIKDIHLENINATKEELSELKSLLISGIIL